MNRLEDILEQIKAQSQPPVHHWHPQHVGNIDIQIDVQGQWFHQGQLIVRESLVGVFASILWREKEQYYLVTPAEKLAIEVADVPFLIHQAELIGGRWVVATNTHQQIVISEDNPVELRLFEGQWVPYVNIRYDLWGRVNRSIYYQWAEVALEKRVNDGARLTLSSQGYQFEVARS